MLEPPTSYISALERSGLNVRRWSVHMADGGERNASRSTNDDQSPLRYVAWSDGNMGLFITDMGEMASAVVDSFVSENFFAIGIPLRGCDGSAVALKMDEIDIPIIPQASFQHFRKGAHFQIDAGPGTLRTLTLLLKADLFDENGWEMSGTPAFLHSVQTGDKSSIIHMHLPSAVEHLADELMAMPASMAFASFFLRAKASEISWRILNHLRDWRDDVAPEDAIDAKLRRNVENLRRLISEEPTHRRSIEELSRYAGVNRTQLRSTFKRLYGMTVSEYRTSLLMQKAEEFLNEQDCSVAEVAYRLRYSDASSFSVAYKRYYGHAPRRARLRVS